MPEVRTKSGNAGANYKGGCSQKTVNSIPFPGNPVRLQSPLSRVLNDRTSILLREIMTVESFHPAIRDLSFDN